MQARGHITKGERGTHRRPTHFFSKVGLTRFHLKMSFSPLVPPPSHYFVEIGCHGQPWQHNVQSNILEIHVGVSIAMTTLIKAFHIVHPEEQYFSLTAKPPPNRHPDSDSLKQDYGRSHLRSRQPTPPTLIHPPAAIPVCVCLELNAAIVMGLPPLSKFPECEVLKYTVCIELTQGGI